MSDLIVTRTFFSLDNRGLRFQNALDDASLQDYMGRTYGRWIPVGYKMIDFVDVPGIGSCNPKASFGSSQLTAARKYELDGDVTAAASDVGDFGSRLQFRHDAVELRQCTRDELRAKPWREQALDSAIYLRAHLVVRQTPPALERVGE